MCSPNPCQNGGLCEPASESGDFACRCPPGWSGRWCHAPGNRPCQLTDNAANWSDANASRGVCLNNGVCRNDALSWGGFECSCPSEWTGRLCQLREFAACSVEL
ncbi:unnamed protein product [Protopolystoma xenopodis]|uniref:EGF-like domain-containing protein n=1 Tax=Protopolystoma xenopodis TaxID=117903 RepID=A0A3S5AH98_9PLAT|nr:unnamed protein product [Protopolystoma xenopodis]